MLPGAHLVYSNVIYSSRIGSGGRKADRVNINIDLKT